MSLALLPPTTVKLIGSSQVITSVSSVIKELMENSIDSGAQNIEVKLEKHGLEKIEVKDDGCGIGKSDATVMCLPHYTSKILSFSDLDTLSSYGFRGEALSSLCNVAQVSVTTKTAEDDVATCYTYDHNGQVTCSKISHIPKGTIVTVTDLFKNLPVRKQFVSSSKRAAEELKRVEKVVKSLGMVHPRLRVTLVHNKFLIWQKTSVGTLRQSVMQVINLNIVKQLHHILHSSEQIRIEMLVPKRDSDVASMCFSNFSEAFFLFINNRPVRNKEVEKAVYNKLFEFFGVYVPTNKYPVCVTCLSLPPGCLDVNLEPNKTLVYFKNQDEVLDYVSQCMHIYYGEEKREEGENSSMAKPPKKRKVEEEYALDPKKVNIEQRSANNVMAEAKIWSVEQDIKCPNEITNFREIQSSSESESCSVVSTSKQDPDPLNQNLDCIFEKFCLEREKEPPSTSQHDKINEIPQCVEPTNPTIDNERSSCKTTSKFFLQINNEMIPQGNEESISNNNDYLDCFKKKHEGDEVTNSKLGMKGIETSDPKFIDCLKKSSEIHATLKKLDAVISKNHQTLSLENEVMSATNLNKTNNFQNFNEEDETELLSEKEDKKPSYNLLESSINSSSPTLSQWSKGEIVNPVGALIRGPCVLGGSKEPDSPSSSQELTNRSVSSQMGCKEMSAFTKFARKMRREILEEQPDLSFTKVAQLLQVHWRHLDTDEKKKYEETIKIKKSSSFISSTKQKPISAYMNGTPNIELNITMEKIRQMVKEPVPTVESSVRLVGQLEASLLWLYHRQDAGVFAVSVSRLREAVRFHQHLDTFAVPSKLLDTSITITPSVLSAAEWQLLLSLERSLNGVIRDERFINNGLLVEVMEGDLEAQLSYIPQNIAYCGVPEMQEILSSLLTHGTKASLAQCRPLKVISFIRSEVMRECSREDPPRQPVQVSELLSYWLNFVSPKTLDCIHHRPVTQCLYSH